jgi:hypothetical protein
MGAFVEQSGRSGSPLFYWLFSKRLLLFNTKGIGKFSENNSIILLGRDNIAKEPFINSFSTFGGCSIIHSVLLDI